MIARCEDLLDLSHDLMGVVHLGYVADCNAAARHHGIQSEQHVSDFLDPSLASLIQNADDASVLTLRAPIGASMFDWRFQRHGDTVLFSARDITANQENESRIQTYLADLRSHSESMEQFVYASSHDIQEPLRTITNYADFLKEDFGTVLPAEGRDFIDNIVLAAKVCRERVRALLTYSRLGNTRNFTWVDTDQLLKDVVRISSFEIEERKATITSITMPIVWGDAAMLGACLSNLLSNALKFCEKGPPEIVFSGGVEDDHWAFSVADNGPGIEPRFHSQIFNVFSRLDKKKDGVGIGLASCKRVAQLHEGRIWVESEACGATFLFTVARPIHEPNPSGRGPCPRCAGDPASTSRPRPLHEPRCRRGRRSSSTVLARRGDLLV